MTDTELSLYEVVLRANRLIDDLIDLQEAQQVTLQQILQSFQDYQKGLEELYDKPV